MLALRQGMRQMGSRTKNKEHQDLFIDMAKAWTNIALVERDVTKNAARRIVQEASKLKSCNNR
jgi:hypothetical protein